MKEKVEYVLHALIRGGFRQHNYTKEENFCWKESGGSRMTDTKAVTNCVGKFNVTACQPDGLRKGVGAERLERETSRQCLAKPEMGGGGGLREIG